MRACDVMTSDVSVVEADMPLPQVAIKMRDEDVGALPVTDDGKLVGIVTDRDIVTRALTRLSDVSAMRACDVMSPGVLCCVEHEAVADVLLNMRDERIRRLPVIDEENHLVGMVSLGDLAQADTHRAGDALAGISRRSCP